MADQTIDRAGPEDADARDKLVWDQVHRLGRKGTFDEIRPVEAPAVTGPIDLARTFDGIDSATNRLVVLDPRRWTLLNGKDTLSREEITTEGGLDVVKHRDKVARVTDAMNAAGIKTSLFIDPDPEQIEMSAKLTAPWVELHTGAYANAYYGAGRAAEFARLVAGARLAHDAGLVVNAGHGINYTNITEVRTLPYLHELNIGHSIISRALTGGIDEAVRTMKALMNPAQ